MAVEDRVRRYAVAVTGQEITNVRRFEAGERHHVFRAGDVVVRVSLSNDVDERDQAARESAVLERVQGIAAPRLLDARLDNEWFDAPVQCTAYVEGEQRGLDRLDDLEQLGAVVRRVHDLPVHDDVDATAYRDGRLAEILGHMDLVRDPLPADVQQRLLHLERLVRGSDPPRTDHRLALLHGDVSPGNIIWTPAPVLLDWEYARTGDPADEIAYLFSQNGLGDAPRAAFWRGYGPSDAVERIAWWERVTMLGSALWWIAWWWDPAAPKPQAYYLEQTRRRLDRLD